MSYNVLFSMSTGLKEPLRVPKGTFVNIMEHVRHVESVLGLETEQYGNNPPHWKSTRPTTDINDEVFCEEAEEHNKWVRHLYDMFSEWSEKPVVGGEILTTKKQQKFWYALNIIDVPPERWTCDYYRSRMEAIYETMRGREGEETSFDEKPLTIKQASAVIRLFESFLDPGDSRLEVPKGYDSLYDADEYWWCDTCGAIANDDIENKLGDCRKKGCSLKQDFNEKGDPY